MTLNFLLSFYPQPTKKKLLGGLFIFLILAELIFTGVFLPQKMIPTALALVPDVVGGPANILNFFEALVADAVKIGKAAYAAAGTWVSAAVDLWDKQNAIVKQALQFVWNRLRKIMLNMIVNDIVKWIQGGGKPRFVTDWQGFLKTAADKAAGQFITEYLDAGFLCGQFSYQLRIALSAPPTFDESVKCTLSEITGNIENFFNDFSSGGWKGWLTVSEMQNNIFGADLLALDKKYSLVAAAQEAAKNEGTSAAGFLGDKVCAVRQCNNVTTGEPGKKETYSGSSLGWKEDELDQGDGNSCECLKWETRTPGRVAGDALQQATGIDIPWIISSKEFAEYAGAIIDAVINRTIKEGVLALQSSSNSSSASGPGITSSTLGGVDMSAYAEASEGNSVITSLLSQEKLLKENLGKTLAEYQTSLDILNQVKATQENTVSILQQTAAVACPLPAGSSLGQETASIQGNCATACPCTSITTKTQPFSINGLGSGTLKQIITSRFELMSGEFITPGCSSLTFSSTESSIINTSLTSDIEIAKVRATMDKIQSQINQTETVITDSVAYQKASQAYTREYETALNNNETFNSTSTVVTETKNTRIQILASLETLTGYKSIDLGEYLDQIMDLSQSMAGENSAIIQKRGFNSDCRYTESGSYRADLCTAQTKQTEIQNNLNSCLANRNVIGV